MSVELQAAPGDSNSEPIRPGDPLEPVLNPAFRFDYGPSPAFVSGGETQPLQPRGFGVQPDEGAASGFLPLSPIEPAGSRQSGPAIVPMPMPMPIPVPMPIPASSGWGEREVDPKQPLRPRGMSSTTVPSWGMVSRTSSPRKPRLLVSGQPGRIDVLEMPGVTLTLASKFAPVSVYECNDEETKRSLADSVRASSNGVIVEEDFRVQALQGEPSLSSRLV